MAETASVPQYENLPAPVGYRSFIKDIGPSMCDLYALTMTYAAWQLGFVEERVTTSHVFCRSLLNNGENYKNANDEIQPVKIPYLVNAGLGLVGEWFDGWKWQDEKELRDLAQKQIPDGKGSMTRLFPNEFLHWLSKQRLTLNIDAIPEGALIFPQVPSMRIKGLWYQQELIEGAVLHMISSSTNQTTVATQERLAAQREANLHGAELVEMSTKEIEYASLAEMSLRRGLSIGGIQATRAAAIAGWDNTSNVYTGMCYGVPTMGTFAHAWVMLHDAEEEAFENWAKVFPGMTVFLADTYDTVEGAKKAIQICKKYDLDLRAIRLDSGNMDYLGREIRPLLDEAGYKKTKVTGGMLATNNVNVKSTRSLYQSAGSEITGFGVGSEVAVNRNHPLLDFVMKLAARFADRSTGRDELVRDLLKLSETREKTTLPGELDAICYIDPAGLRAGDTIIPKNLDIGDGRLSRDVYSAHTETGEIKIFPKGVPFKRLLEPWMREGDMVQEHYMAKNAPAILAAAREACRQNMAQLDQDHLKLPGDMPHSYGVGIARELLDKRSHMIDDIKSQSGYRKQLSRFNLNAA